MFVEINPAYLIALLFFFTCGCYLYLFIFTLVSNTKSKLRQEYLSAGLCLTFCSLCYGLMTIAGHTALCRVFWAAGFIALSLFFSRWLLFSFNLVVNRSKIARYIVSAASGIALILSVLCVFSNDVVFVFTGYGARFSYQNSLLFKTMTVFMTVIAIAFIVFDFRWWRESEIKRNRVQAFLFFILSGLIAPVGFTTDFIIPAFTEYTAVPLAAICFLIVSMPLFVAMWKYKTLSITVPDASGYIYHTVTIPTLVLDHKNSINLENEAAFDFLGCSVVGGNIADIILLDEKTPEQSFFDKEFTSKKVTVNTPLGVSICDLLLAIEYDKYNDALCKIVLLRDITESEYKDNMLRAALEQAKVASKAKSNFLSSMSHEIRAPMNAIIGMTAIGKRSYSIEKKDDAFGKIDVASKHLLGVINDILDMSKIEADKLELSPVSFDFEKMLQKVADVINFRVDERKQKFYVNIGKDIPMKLIGDDQRLSQVVANLLTNAVKFTPNEGSIRLDSQLISKEDDMCRLQISVEDTGIGITDEQKSRLFQAFEQAEADTSRNFGGTGLGLAISKRIVELMGGDIWVTSEPGKGSKFCFNVLLKQDLNEKKRLLDESGNWKNIRIFAVDEEQEIRDYFIKHSEAWGIACSVAENAGKAVEMLEADDNYNIYFFDWKLSGMNGVEFARQIKTKIADKPVVIIYTLSDWSVIEDEARAAGVDKFIAKPLFPSALVDMINQCIGIKGARDTDEKDGFTDDFSGSSILLAEDVEINREILLELLEPTRLSIECAETGVQALDMFARAPDKYEMIFMDIQMPEMDGYEATRKIRALESQQAKTIPIIAMTANVFREDIDRCLDAGMNGHVGKPLDIDEVISQLRKYLHRSKVKPN